MNPLLYGLRAAAATADEPSTTALSPSEALSGISGSISLVAWMVLLLPQLIENYKNGRADALSMGFLTAWLIGDITSLAGALWGGLLPTVIALAFYFCFADVILLSQTIYYNHITSLRRARRASRRSSSPHTAITNDPTTPLLQSTHRRNSHSCRRPSHLSERRRSSNIRRDSLSPILKQDVSKSQIALRNTAAILAVCIAGAVGWTFAWKTGAWSPQDGNSSDDDMPLGAEILGYTSAAFYLCARIPQIAHNARNKSCDGLSVLFFMLSLLGNLSYGGGILFHSVERQYVMDNLPWLAGSLGTMLEDFIIFYQFVKYGRQEDDEESLAVVDE